MYDFLEDYVGSEYYDAKSRLKVLSQEKKHRDGLINGTSEEQFNDFIFQINEVDDKYYLSEKVAKYVLCTGTKNFKTPVKTDLDIARPLLILCHKMHRAGVDNYVTIIKQKVLTDCVNLLLGSVCVLWVLKMILSWLSVTHLHIWKQVTVL